MPLIKQNLKTFLIDPPWPEVGGGKYKRGADRHYKVMSVDEIIDTIKACPLFTPQPSGAHLYLWATNNHLQNALTKVIPALGFNYKTTITWVKQRFGLGYYFRGQTEHMLFATYGKTLKPISRNQTTIIHADKTRRHSEKPREQYEKIEAVSPGPYVELFARGKAFNSQWSVWGDESEQD